MTEVIDDALVVDIARQLVIRAAPDELPLFAATSRAYLENPAEVSASISRDETLGFGLEAAVVFVTPVALEVAKSVIKWLASQVTTALEDEASTTIRAHIHRLFHRAESPAESAPRLSADQLAAVRRVALEKARELALPEPKADLLADAVVGSLASS